MVSTRALASKARTPPNGKAAEPAVATTPPPPSLAARLGGTDGVRNAEGTQEYERRRDERIRENMERMQRLGIVDLALKFKSSISGSGAVSKRPYNKRAIASPDLPPRRSSRLQNVSPASYSEICATRKDEMPQKKTRIPLEEGPIEEVYTDEHEKLLGTCETSWTLFMDGYSKEGARIYDPVKGKTCHQCRQKTLGHRTHCRKCNLVQGQFCGDCLYMRYGENVLETNKNPDWICPVCRGICNCSICRTKKGWAPTGMLYKKVLSLGFKSVAHFLIQTKRVRTNTEELVSAHTISAKRSLPFTDEVGPLQINDCNNYSSDDHCNRRMIFFDGKNDNDSECSRDGDMENLDEYCSISTLETSKTLRKKQKKETESAMIVRPSMDTIAGRLRNRRELQSRGANNNNNDHCIRQIVLIESDDGSQLCCDEGKDAECIGNEEMQNSDKCNGSLMPERVGKPGKEHKKEMQSALSVKPSPDSIAGRLRSHNSRYKDSDSNGEKETQSPDRYVSSSTQQNSEKLEKSSKEEDIDLLMVPSLSCVTGRQKTRGIFNEDSGCKSRKNNIALSNGKLANEHFKGKDHALLMQPSIDCIDGRLGSPGADKEAQTTILSNNATALESNEKIRNRGSNRKELALIVIPTADCISGRLRSRKMMDNACQTWEQCFP